MTDAEVVTTQTTTHTTVTSSTSGPAVDVKFDPNYIKSVQGILKIAEIVLSFITFCVLVTEPSWVRGPSHNFLLTISILFGFASLVIFTLFVFRIIYKLTSIPMNLILAVGYIVMAVCYVIGFILVAANALTPSHGSAATLGCIASVVYLFGMLFALRDYRAASTQSAGGATTSTPHYTTDPPPAYPANSEVYDPKY